MRNVLFIAALALVGGCGDSSPANVAGDYTLAITNGANGCQLNNWTVGGTTTGVGVTMTQAQGSASATAVVSGGAALYLDAVVGGSSFTGAVSGNDVDLTLFGTRSHTSGACTYTINAALRGTLNGDALAGTIDYTSATNGSPDCGTIQGCHSTESFNGTRPPPAP